MADDSEVLDLDGSSIPLLRPSRWLKFNGIRHFHELETPPAIDKPAALIASFGDKTAGIVINSCWREREVTIRRLEGDLPLPPAFSGCAILGDGRVVPLVDVPEFLGWISHSHAIAQPSSLLPETNTPIPDGENTILIVDDSINVRRFLALTLEKAGYRVEQAKDGQDALDKLQSGLTVSATICDIEMPHLDGYGFLAQVKANANLKQMPGMDGVTATQIICQRFPQTKAIVLSAHDNDVYLTNALRAGAKGYLLKNTGAGELAATIRSVDKGYYYSQKKLFTG